LCIWGTMAYQNYLSSRRWKQIRARVLRRDQHKCRSCGDRATQVHHGSYDAATMRGERLDALYAICQPCHAAVSLDMFGFKREWKQQREWTRALRAEPKRGKPGPPKPPRKPFTIADVRARSLDYAEGRMK
jgi:5-methylcytosine-specific restriction endonuclease McrA